MTRPHRTTAAWANVAHVGKRLIARCHDCAWTIRCHDTREANNAREMHEAGK